MKRNIFIIIALIGFIGLFSNCEKDETKIVMKESVTAPVLELPTSLALSRDKGTDTLTFVGTPVDPGFAASAKYYLEACLAGNNFENVTEIYNGDQASKIKFAISDLNQILLENFEEDATSSIDFRLRSVLTVDGGNGAPGTGDDTFEYSSEPVRANVTLYGLLRLDLIGSGITQKIVSPLGDGKYFSYVQLDNAQSFTLTDGETGINYGANGAALEVDGASFSVATDGWYALEVDINALTYSLEYYNPSVVGAFTGWGGGTPGDYFMIYDLKSTSWKITLDLPTGELKFRLNADWGVNWGPGGTGNLDIPANGGTFALPNSSNNLNITTAGNYSISFKSNGKAGTCTFKRNTN